MKGPIGGRCSSLGGCGLLADSGPLSQWTHGQEWWCFGKLRLYTRSLGGVFALCHSTRGGLVMLWWTVAFDSAPLAGCLRSVNGAVPLTPFLLQPLSYPDTCFRFSSCLVSFCFCFPPWGVVSGIWAPLGRAFVSSGRVLPLISLLPLLNSVHS